MKRSVQIITLRPDSERKYWTSLQAAQGSRKKYPQCVAVVVRVHFARFSNARKWKGEQSSAFVVYTPLKIQRKWPVRRLMWSIQVPRRPNSSNFGQITNYFSKLLKVSLLCSAAPKYTQSFASFCSIERLLTCKFLDFSAFRTHANLSLSSNEKCCCGRW